MLMLEITFLRLKLVNFKGCYKMWAVIYQRKNLKKKNLGKWDRFTVYIYKVYWKNILLYFEGICKIPDKQWSFI